MKTIKRTLINICSDKLHESKHFYTKLFDFDIDYDSDWFIHLISKDKQFELGIIERNNEIVSKEIRNAANGFYITFVIDNVDELFELVQRENFEIVEKPTDTFYGQRRLLLKDPNGTLIDVSSPI